MTSTETITLKPASAKHGFVDSHPHLKTLELLADIADVLERNEAYLPITARQVFYALVTRRVIGKTRNDYKNLCKTLTRARRAGVISFEHIRDDGFVDSAPLEFANVQDFHEDVIERARDYRTDRQANQKQRVALWCETNGMAPIIQAVAFHYGAPVLSSGGSDGITPKHEMGHRLWNCTVLYVGDYDPSGLMMYRSLREDLGAFAEHYGNTIDVERIAVTEEQIEQYDLPRLPVKNPGHSHAQTFDGLTTEAEALPATTLTKIVADEIEARLNLDLFNDMLEVENREREQLIAEFAGGVSYERHRALGDPGLYVLRHRGCRSQRGAGP